VASTLGADNPTRSPSLRPKLAPPYTASAGLPSSEAPSTLTRSRPIEPDGEGASSGPDPLGRTTTRFRNDHICRATFTGGCPGANRPQGRIPCSMTHLAARERLLARSTRMTARLRLNDLRRSARAAAYAEVSGYVTDAIPFMHG